MLGPWDVEGVIELLSHPDDRASRIVSAFVVGDSDDELETQCEEHLRPCTSASFPRAVPLSDRFNHQR